MKYYLAPMEGITGYVFRNVQHRHFGQIDRYFTPFITPAQTKKLTSREREDLATEHNQGMNVVPQILTNQAEGFLWAAGRCADMGYQEVNLNLGCPSGTVVSKGRGAGFLADPWKLERFLAEVTEGLSAMGLRLSIKTRIGVTDPEEFADILAVYNQFDLTELIIHPRVRTDYYKNTPNMAVFEEAAAMSKNPVCYNGDLFDAAAVKGFAARFPQVQTVMIGRGLIANPGLTAQLASGQISGEASGARGLSGMQEPDMHPLDVQKLQAFHEDLLAAYREAIPGDRNVLFKMKELWFYLGCMFEDSGRLLKKLKKAGSMAEYRQYAAQLFAECPLDVHGGFHHQ